MANFQLKSGKLVDYVNADSSQLNASLIPLLGEIPCLLKQQPHDHY